ncbi:hypothetical protein PRIPAC_89185 [Pristionchus pacificus]|uniref:Carboxypeptidase n=1 Tax=Pristionchus pacificus TaxID=54126 RepID=A0A2A6B6H0_PRIPA|nr:hypothetical protein PRIPAC_89185 [Pristionchus pacificus]|eukprot:PDM61464.1 Peptidase [Pristionchus pacificus]
MFRSASESTTEDDEMEIDGDYTIPGASKEPSFPLYSGCYIDARVNGGRSDQLRSTAVTASYLAEQPAIEWHMSSGNVSSAYEVDSDTIPLYKDILALVQGDFRIIFYTGDMDLVCPPLQVAFGARRVADDNGMRDIKAPVWTYLGDYGGARTSYINLPGAPLEPSFPMYSGFLDASDNDTEHKLFYVLCEAIHADPATAPLLIWLNGGPGSSSLFGLLMIHGPFLLNAEGQLRYNDFSWNQYAIVLYLETPTGVGFSHSNDGNIAYNDVFTARINAKALQDFMTRVHPRYSNRDFYITGESYAGVYNPYFAREVLAHVKSGEFTNPNLKGIVMGNALMDNISGGVASALQLYSLGMIPEKYGKELFDFWENITEGNKIVEPSDELNRQIYDVTRFIGGMAVYDLPLQCNEPKNDSVWHVAKPAPNPECDPATVIAAYLRRDDVQYHLNSDTVPLYKDILDLAPGDFRILFYTGDMDLVCPPLHVAYGAKRIAEANGMKQSNENHWTYLGDYGGAQTSYYTTDGRRFTIDVITVRGASHMVPQKQPDRAFQMINNFIIPREPFNYSSPIPRRTSA